MPLIWRQENVVLAFARLVLPSAQKEKKVTPGRRSLTAAEFIGCPTIAETAKEVKAAPLATNGAKSETSAEKPQLQPGAEGTGKSEAPAQDLARDQERTPLQSFADVGGLINMLRAGKGFHGFRTLQELVRRKSSLSWRVRGDCRCLFRAVMRAYGLDTRA